MPRFPGAPAVALALVATVPVATAQESPPPPPAHPPAAPAPRHPSTDTGWARARVAGEALRTAPDPSAGAIGRVSSTAVAGRSQRVARGPGGGLWVRIALPGGLGGWAPGEALVAAPAPPALAPATRRALVRATASLGRRSALVVRDPLGRTLFAAGTRRPLSIASVTKLATVGAALGRRPLPLRSVAAILGPSDNARAQALSTRLGGGNRRAGARRAVEAAATLGASISLVDGSGLSPANRASAGEVADLLLGLRALPRFRTLLRGMPVAGRSGTLRWRLTGTAAAGRLRAKTGSLFDAPASALAGYLWPHGSGLRPDRALVLAMVSNGASPYRARPVQDAVAAALAAPDALRHD